MSLRFQLREGRVRLNMASEPPTLVYDSPICKVIRVGLLSKYAGSVHVAYTHGTFMFHLVPGPTTLDLDAGTSWDTTLVLHGLPGSNWQPITTWSRYTLFIALYQYPESLAEEAPVIPTEVIGRWEKPR